MPMNYKTYAKALFESFLEKNEIEFNTFFDNFILELKNKKKITLLPKIFKEVEKYTDLATKKDMTELILKNKNDLEKFKEKISSVEKEFNLDDLAITENKNIIGGFILKNSKKILDKSYKKKLLKIYENIKK